MENKENKTHMLLPFIIFLMISIIYFIAFREARDKVRDLEHKLEICKIRK